MAPLPDYPSLRTAFLEFQRLCSPPIVWPELEACLFKELRLCEERMSADEVSSAGVVDASSLELYVAHLVTLRDSGLLPLMSIWGVLPPDLLEDVAKSIGVKSWQIQELIDQLRSDLGLSDLDFLPQQPVGLASDSASVQVASGEYLSESADDQHLDRTASEGMTVDPATLSSSALSKPTLSGVPASGQPKGLTPLFVVLAAIFIPGFIAFISSNQSSRPPGSVLLAGVDLPVTNSLCNTKKTFCIQGLASLVDSKKSTASYRMREYIQGNLVNINGSITIRSTALVNGRKAITFNWYDDARTTSPAYLASGYLRLGSDPAGQKPGIRSVFTVTDSRGSATPLGLENISFLFPQ